MIQVRGSSTGQPEPGSPAPELEVYSNLDINFEYYVSGETNYRLIDLGSAVHLNQITEDTTSGEEFPG
jgi:hypothetical protein